MLKWKSPEKLRARWQNHQPVNWGLIPQCIQPITTSNTKKLLKLCPNKITGTQQLFPPEWETREQYCRLFHELVTNGSFGLECTIFLGKARFALNGNMQAGTITDTDVWKIPMQFAMFTCMTCTDLFSPHVCCLRVSCFVLYINSAWWKAETTEIISRQFFVKPHFFMSSKQIKYKTWRHKITLLCNEQ
jgi:hypothetical protein